MVSRSALIVVSSVQLVAQLAGHLVALRRRRSFDVPFLTGSPDHVGRDWLWFGTAYSAPSYMVAAQVWAISRLLRGPDERARRALRLLGTGMCFGYPIERMDRARIRPGGFEPIETPIVVVGWSGAITMALLGRPEREHRDSSPVASGIQAA